MANFVNFLATWCVVLPFAAAPQARARLQADPAQEQADPLAEAKAVMAQENWKGAATAFLKFLRKQPSSPHAPEATFWTGYCLVKDCDFEQAIQTLRPFESGGAGGFEDDKWADDALSQLGQAYQGAGEDELALECWRRLVEKYPKSVWRNETLINIVNLLYSSGKFADCFPYCEQVMREIADSGSTWETRYIGAFCLNALKRFDDSERWIERWFDPMNPTQEAWRTVLGAQRDLLEGRADAAAKAIESLQNDFTDLDGGEWIDVLMRASLMLRVNEQQDQAFDLLRFSLHRLGGQPEQLINGVLDELDAALGKNKLERFLDLMTMYANDEGLNIPATVRVLLRNRLVADLRKAKVGSPGTELEFAL